MICQKCSKEIPEQSQFCPYCGAKAELQQESFQQAPQQENFQQAPQPENFQQAPQQESFQQAPQQESFQQAPQPVNNYQVPPYGQGNFALEKEVKDTKSLGLAALIGGIFIPLVGFICGGIGLSKISKLRANADAAQQEQLNKSKKLCLAGIIVPAVLMVLSTIISIVWGIYIGKRIFNELQNYSEDNSVSYFDENGNPNENFKEYFDQFGIEIQE